MRDSLRPSLPPLSPTVVTRIDQVCDRFEAAWKAQQQPRIEDYLEDVEPTGRDALLHQLLVLELDLRIQRGDAPSLAEYQRRFPTQGHILDEAFRQSGLAAVADSGHESSQPSTLGLSRATAESTGTPTDGGRRPAGDALRVRCSQCHNPIELVDHDVYGELACPSCGTTFRLAGEESADASESGQQRTRIGHFEFLEQLGSGAFGAVWKAHDAELDRIVAIKIPRQGQIDPQNAEQFLREARAASQLRHPNIVAVHEIGREGDRLYIVSDFIDGCSLQEWLTEHRPAPREAAELCAKIADALHAAHEKGVIHRDLKPANVMLDEGGEPHVMDFGLAKREAAEITMTVEGQILGTPAYMSPEQARGESHAADRRTDVYSLGVMLFEMLTGERPFRGNVRMLLDQAQHEEPPSPRKFDNQVPRDLETICLKCLQKEPSRRYAPASALAAELRRWLRGEPIQSRPISRLEHACRWCQRNRLVAFMAIALLLVMSSATLISLLFARTAILERNRADKRTLDVQQQTVRVQELLQAEEAARNRAEKERQKATAAAIAEKTARQRAENEHNRAEEQRELAETEKQHAQRSLYINQIALAHDRWLDAEIAECEKVLEACAPDLRGWEWGYFKRLCHSEILTFRESLGRPVFSPDGRQFVTCSFLQGVDPFGGPPSAPQIHVYIWDATKNQQAATLTLSGHLDRINSAAFSPDGKRMVTGSDDKTIKIWDLSTTEITLTISHQEGKVTAVAFSPDGTRVVAGVEASPKGSALKIWDASTGQECSRFKVCEREHCAINNVVFTADGKRIVTSSNDAGIGLWDAITGKGCVRWPHSLPPELRGQLGDPVCLPGSLDSTSLALSPDGKMIAAGVSRVVTVWHLDTGYEYTRFCGHADLVACVAFSPDSQRIVSGSRDRTIKIWNTFSRDEERTLRGHAAEVTSVAFSPDGKRIISSSYDGTKLWDANACQEFESVPGGGYSLSFGRDSRCVLLCAGANGSYRMLHGLNLRGESDVKIYDLDTGDSILDLGFHRLRSSESALSPDGKMFVTSSYRGTFTVRESDTGQEVFRLTGPTPFANCVAFSPDGKWIGCGSSATTVPICDAKTGREIVSLHGHDEPVYSIAFHPDGKQVVSGSLDKTLKLWDIATGRQVASLRGHTDLVTSIAFRPDGRQIASGSVDKTVRIWETSTGKSVLTIPGHGAVRDVMFSPDGRRIASETYGGEIKVFDAVTGQEVRTLPPITRGLVCAAYDAEGRRIVTAIRDRTAVIRNSFTGMPMVALRGHEDLISSVAFSPDGKRVLTASEDFTLKVWDAQSGAVLLTLRHDKPAHVVASEKLYERLENPAPQSVFGVFSPDGRHIASAAPNAETVQIWDAASGKGTLALAVSGYGGIAFSPDGCRLATTSVKSEAIWDLKTGKKLLTPRRSGTIWNVKTGKKLLTLNGDVGSPISFSPDGQRILALSGEKARLWDATTGQEILSLPGPDMGDGSGGMRFVTFSPDGSRIVGLDRGGLVVWRGTASPATR